MVIFKQPLYWLGLYAIAFIICLSLIFASYTYYINQLSVKTNEILQENYQVILNHSLIKFKEILNKLPSDSSGKSTTIKIEKSDIITCYSEKCKKRNLFEFSSVLDKYIPDHVYYRIDVNKQLLHRNHRLEHYQLEKNYHINDNNQLSIFISINPKYLHKIHKQVVQPFVVTVIASTCLFILFIISTRLLIRYFNDFYFVYYKKLFNSKLEQVKESHKNEMFIKESRLMKKIWNLEYSKDKDGEFNRLFSQKANQLALLLQDKEYTAAHQDQVKTSHCSIILYQKNTDKSYITTQTIVEKFSDRFSNSEENISVNISSSCQKIAFSSKEFLYQVMYSIINCIIFMLKDQDGSAKYDISFDISKTDSKVCLLCRYNGLPIDSEEEFTKFSNYFLKNNANPFCVSIKQIFFILKKDGFECVVGHDNLNFIKISESQVGKVETKEENNIIKFRK